MCLLQCASNYKKPHILGETNILRTELRMISHKLGKAPIRAAIGNPTDVWDDERKALLKAIKVVGDRQVVAVINTSSVCQESYPCQHSGEDYIVFADGSVLELINCGSMTLGVLAKYFTPDAVGHHFMEYADGFSYDGIPPYKHSSTEKKKTEIRISERYATARKILLKAIRAIEGRRVVAIATDCSEWDEEDPYKHNGNGYIVYEGGKTYELEDCDAVAMGVLTKYFTPNAVGGGQHFLKFAVGFSFDGIPPYKHAPKETNKKMVCAAKSTGESDTRVIWEGSSGKRGEKKKRRRSRSRSSNNDTDDSDE